MNYIFAIKTAIFMFPIIAFFFTIPFILYEYHKYGSIHKLKVFIIYSFILYILTIYFLVILPLPAKNTLLKPKENMIRLVPFGFVGDLIKESSFTLTNPKTYLKALTEPCFYTVIFNVFMMIPFGMYLRYYFKCSLKKTVIFSFLLSLFFELTQVSGLYFIYPYPYRVFDVDDLAMNTLVGIVGYYINGFIDKFLPTREKIDRVSLENGKTVSGLRRITIFLLDFFLYIFITLFISIFLRNNYLKYIIFIIYYIGIPYTLNGKTPGSKFLNVRLEYKNYKFVRSTLRILFIYIYYFYLPYKLMFMIQILKDYLKLDTSITVALFLIGFIFIIVFYLGNMIIILRKKIIYYDKMFNVTYISTI